jgi:hypothetical protein
MSQGSTDETFSDLGFSDLGDIENQAGIVRENDKPLVSRELYLVVNQPIPNPQPGRPKRRSCTAGSMNRRCRAKCGLPLPGGGRFSDAGVRTGGGAAALCRMRRRRGLRVLAVGEGRQRRQSEAATVGGIR